MMILEETHRDFNSAGKQQLAQSRVFLVEHTPPYFIYIFFLNYGWNVFYLSVFYAFYVRLGEVKVKFAPQC